MNNNNDLSAAVTDILIVEDSETQANQLAYLLSSNGYHVRVAKNGRLGLQEAYMVQPNLIISDISMPEMDGFEMCRALKNDRQLQHIPVILVTSLTSLYDVIKGLDCGADNFIRKPYEEKYLLGRIRFILANRELRRNERVQLGMQINLGGQTHFVTAERQQIFDLLISTYEEAIHMTEELRTQQKLIAHSYQSIEGLYQMAATLSPAITEKEVVVKALECVLELPGIIEADINLLEDSGKLRTTASHAPGLDSDVHVTDTDLKNHEKPASALLRTSALSGDSLLFSGSSDELTATGKRVSIPLMLGQKTLGTMDLVLDMRVTGKEEDLQVLNTVGSQIAVALERANLYTNMENMVREKTDALYAERNLSTAVVNTTGALVFLVDPEGRIVLFNPACEQKLGWKCSEVQGQVFWKIFLQPEHASTIKAFFQNMKTSNLPLHIQDDWIAKDKSIRKIIWSTTYLKKPDQSIEYILGTGIDVTDLHDAEQKVQYLRNFDSLTGLPNRVLLKGGLQLLQEKIAGKNKIIGFMMIDFARMPLIRETLGAKAEQSILLQIAGRLKEWDSSVDRIARYGDSSFVLIAPRKSPKDLSFVARKVLAFLKQPYNFEGQELHLDAGIGITVFPDDGQDFDSLLQGAETAMRSAFNGKTAHYKFYKPELNRGSYERFKLENALRRALERDELILHYQPQVDLNTGKIVGLEALVRWEHPELGLISPGNFIPIAEETGLIIPIGTWVLRTACMQANEWKRSGLGELRIAVNLSARQFVQPDLVRTVATVLNETKLPAASLELEITESLMMDNVEQCIGKLDSLRALGVKLSIDDFGTGYSNLSYLKQFPIDVLKIDQSFVREINLNSSDAAISSTIISMAHTLGMRVIAEGVETEAQCKFLSRQMCNEIQGYFYSPPIPANEVEILLKEERSLPRHLLKTHKPHRTLLLAGKDPGMATSLKGLADQHGFKILIAENRKDALTLLMENLIDVIVFSQSAQDRVDIEFIRNVKSSFPQAMHIVLSDLEKLQSMALILNEGVIHKFLTKPCDEQHLYRHIIEAFEYKEIAGQKQT